MLKTFESRIAFQMLIIDDTNGDIRQWKSLLDGDNMRQLMLFFSFILGAIMYAAAIVEIANDLRRSIIFTFIVLIIITKSIHFAIRKNY